MTDPRVEAAAGVLQVQLPVAWVMNGSIVNELTAKILAAIDAADTVAGIKRVQKRKVDAVLVGWLVKRGDDRALTESRFVAERYALSADMTVTPLYAHPPLPPEPTDVMVEAALKEFYSPAFDMPPGTKITMTADEMMRRPIRRMLTAVLKAGLANG